MYCCAVQHVGHRRSGLRRRHVDRRRPPRPSPCRTRAASRRAARRRRWKPPSPAISSVLVTSTPMRPWPPGARNGQALQRRVVPDVVRRLAVRRSATASSPLFMSIARDAAVRRLDQRQALHGQAGTACRHLPAPAAPPAPPVAADRESARVPGDDACRIARRSAAPGRAARPRVREDVEDAWFPDRTSRPASWRRP